MTEPTYEELQAQVERLRDYVMRGSPWNTNPEKCERGLVLSETPAQSLAALKAQWQAEAVKKLGNWLYTGLESDLAKHELRSFPSKRLEILYFINDISKRIKWYADNALLGTGANK